MDIVFPNYLLLQIIFSSSKRYICNYCSFSSSPPNNRNKFQLHDIQFRFEQNKFSIPMPAWLQGKTYIQSLS